MLNLSKSPFVMSLSKIPFVVSLSNHAVGANQHALRHAQRQRLEATPRAAGLRRHADVARALLHARMRSLLLALALLMLAACASSGGVLQHAGVVDVYDMQITTDLNWARIKDPLQHEEIWTIDGMALNSLSIFSGIADGQHVFMLGRERSSHRDGPWFHSGMRADEIRDVVIAAMIRQGMVNVASQNLRPQRFGTVDGLRFEFTAVSNAGLIYKGKVAAAQRDGKLDLLLWKAPAEYYHDRDAASIDRMLDGLRFK